MKARITAPARRDMVVILAVSREQFGEGAQRRSRALLEQAISDLEANPGRVGVVAFGESAEPIRLYHSRHSRGRVATRLRVARPRHIIVFRVSELEILRVLHEAMDLPRRLRAG